MTRKLIIIALVLGIAVFALPAQTRVPSGSDNWLSNSGLTASGDRDGLNVFFFEIPDSVTSPIYFAIQDPGVNDGNPQDQYQIDAGESMTFTLMGGNGGLTHGQMLRWPEESAGSSRTSKLRSMRSSRWGWS